MIRTGTAVQETEGGRYNLAGRSAHRRHLWRQSRGDARRNYGDRFPWWRSDNIYAGASRPGRTAPSSWRLHAVASAGGWCGACTNVAEGHECFITSSFKEWKKIINQWVELIKAKKVERGECGPPARAGELQVWPLKLCLSLVLIPLKGPVESRGPPNPPPPSDETPGSGFIHLHLAWINLSTPAQYCCFGMWNILYSNFSLEKKKLQPEVSQTSVRHSHDLYWQHGRRHIIPWRWNTVLFERWDYLK